MLGENRVQEADEKAARLPDVAWHVVGRLQGNKASRAVALFSMVQSVDSVDLARRLDTAAGRRIDAGESRPWAERLPVLLQVNVDGDPAKAGFPPDAVAAALGALAELGRLEVRGLMTVGRLVATADEARPTFRRLRDLATGLRDDGAPLGPELSMGMSDDFEVAIEEGATIVRVGRAIFGERRIA